MSRSNRDANGEDQNQKNQGFLEDYIHFLNDVIGSVEATIDFNAAQKQFVPPHSHKFIEIKNHRSGATLLKRVVGNLEYVKNNLDTLDGKKVNEIKNLLSIPRPDNLRKVNRIVNAMRRSAKIKKLFSGSNYSTKKEGGHTVV